VQDDGLTDVAAAEAVNQHGQVIEAAQSRQHRGRLVTRVTDALINASKQQHPSTRLLDTSHAANATHAT